MPTTDDYPADISTTGSLQAGGKITAQLGKNDSDWFRIDLAANSYYTFDLSAPSFAGSIGNFSLNLWSAQGSSVQSVASTYPGAGIISAFKTGAAGSYYIASSLGYYSSDQLFAYTLAASAGTVDVVGDTLQTATAISLDQEFSSAFEGPNDTDVYKIALQKGVSYSIKQSWINPNGSTPTNIVVSDADGASVYVSGRDNNYSFTAAASGDYYVAMRGGIGVMAAPLNYSLLLAPAADDFAATASGAGALTVGGTTRGRLDVSGDRDWYAVTLTANTVYWLTAKPDSSSSGMAYNSGTVQLKVFDGAEKLMASISGNNSQSVLQFVPTKTGTYYFEVGDSYGGSGNYLASVALGLRDDYGNDLAGAAAQALGSTIAGKLETATDSDMFKFAVKAGASYVFELTAKTGGSNAGWILSGQDGNGSSGGMQTYVMPGVTEYRVFTASYTGDYFLSVAGNGFSGPAAYTLKASTPITDDYSASTFTKADLPIGRSLNGSIDYVGDSDWIKVKLAAGNTYAFVLDGLGSGKGTLDLSNINLSIVSGNTDNFPGLSMMSGLSGKGYTFTTQSSGDYYLAVSPFGAGTTVGGSYAISAYNLSGDIAQPGLLSFAPGKGSTGASLTGNITLTFDELVRGGDGTLRLIDSAGNVVDTAYMVAGDERVQINGNVLTFNPHSNLLPGVKYTLEVPAGALLDYAGNKFLADAVYSFTTRMPVAQGGNGNDLLSGVGASAQLSGGDGVDTVAYSGRYGDYSVMVSAGETKVRFLFGNAVPGDTLSGVERLQFSDRNIALDADGHGGQAYSLYQAAFGRTPDQAGLGYWMAQLDEGMQLHSAAESFLSSPEFQTLYGANSNNAVFLANLYRNVLHREGDAAGLQHWSDMLAQGASRAAVLIGFSQSAEYQAEVLAVIGNGFDYTPYG